MNAACLQLFGADLASIERRSLRTLVVPAAAADADAFVARVFNGEPGTFEFELASVPGQSTTVTGTHYRCYVFFQ